VATHPLERPRHGPLAGLTIRPIEAGDVERLRRLFYRLSARTVYLRFFTPVQHPSDALLHHLAEVDHDIRQAVVAVDGDEIVGVARYDRDPDDPTRAEAAIVVEDAWQGQGLGHRLLIRLAGEALDHGIGVLTASVLGENQRMMALARDLVSGTSVRLEHGEWLLETPLPTSDPMRQAR
jgi:RimJ/RimL family protein N-acetyltransferase